MRPLKQLFILARPHYEEQPDNPAVVLRLRYRNPDEKQVSRELPLTIAGKLGEVHILRAEVPKDLEGISHPHYCTRAQTGWELRAVAGTTKDILEFSEAHIQKLCCPEAITTPDNTHIKSTLSLTYTLKNTLVHG